MSTFRKPASSGLPTRTRSLRGARFPIDWGTLRGARLRARELGILQEFWELVSAGNLDGARERLALEQQLDEERARQRRESVLYLLAVSVTVGVTLLWWSLLDGR